MPLGFMTTQNSPCYMLKSIKAVKVCFGDGFTPCSFGMNFGTLSSIPSCFIRRAESTELLFLKIGRVPELFHFIVLA
jgi:hypothetical protein